MADRHGHVALARHHVAAGEDAGTARHHRTVDHDAAVLHLKVVDAFEELQVRLLTEGEHDAVGAHRLELTRRDGTAALVKLHLLDADLAFVGMRNGGEPLHVHAFLDGLLDLELMGGSALAGAAVNDQRLGAKALCGAGHVDGGVAAAVDHHAAAQKRLLLAFHGAEHRNGVKHVRGVAGGNVGSAGKACANAEEHGVKAAFLHFGGQIGHLAGELELHAKLGDARDLLVKNLTGQTVLRNAVAHHAACGLGAVAHADLMTHAGEMVGGGKACRTCAHDKNALAALRLGLLERPTVFKRMVAEKAFDGVDADGLVELAAIAGGLARVVAHAAHAGGEGIVLDDLLPGVTVVAAFSMVEPCLALLAGGTLGIARREAVHIDRAQPNLLYQK